jgi:hypothetical protein
MRLNDCNGYMVSLFHEWEGFLVNPNFLKKGSGLQWNHLKDIMLDHSISSDKLAQLEKDAQYSFQVSDGSLIRMLYTFADNEHVSAASLAYLGVPREEYEEASIPWIRIDHAPTDARGMTHTATHLHSSMSAEIRVPLSVLPTPAQFIDLVCAWFYPTTYTERRGVAFSERLANICEERLKHDSDPLAKLVLHLRMPDRSDRLSQQKVEAVAK